MLSCARNISEEGDSDLQGSRPAAEQQVHEVAEQLEADSRKLARGSAATQHGSPVGAFGERLSAEHDRGSLCICRQ